MLGAEQGKHLAPLDRHRFRHHQREFVAARRGDESERDAGVAGSRFDDHAASRSDAPLRLERVDHRYADAVLDAGDRVEELELGQQVGAHAAFACDAVDPDQRRLADGLGDRRIDAAAAERPRRVAFLDLADFRH